MLDTRFEFGDQVRLANRPEWGRGSVVKIEEATAKGQAVQRVSVRFEHAGLKALVAERAQLEKVNGEGGDPGAVPESRMNLDKLDRMRGSEWLTGVAEKQIQEHMIALPEEIRDPFNSFRKRLRQTLDLYRFEPTGRGLVDWAIVQTELKDPLSRFNRHELEQFFARWSQQLDIQLLRLLEEARREPAILSALLKDAPRQGRNAARRLHALR